MTSYKPIPSLSRAAAHAFLCLVSTVGHDNGCWIWMGQRTERGYGKWRGLRAHRVAFVLDGKPLAADMALDHLCRNTSCVNPTHLEAVPNDVNVMRGNGYMAQQARKTHCKHGHPFTPENTIVRGGRGSRQCRVCKNEHYRKDWKAGKRKRGANG